jgi:hypothetical protein
LLRCKVASVAKIMMPEGTAGIQINTLIALTVEEGQDWKDVQVPGKRLRDCCVARLRDCSVARLRDCCVVRLRDFFIFWGHPAFKSTR